MNKNTQIVFVHNGSSWYLPYVLNQAKIFNKNAQVHLLGNGYKDVGIYTQSLDSLETKSSVRFREVYEHVSTNPMPYELLCWLRWFYILEYMDQNKLDSIMYLDLDVLLFSSREKISRTYGDFGDCAFLIPNQENHQNDLGSESGHTSYWTMDSLA